VPLSSVQIQCGLGAAALLLAVGAFLGWWVALPAAVALYLLEAALNV